MPAAQIVQSLSGGMDSATLLRYLHSLGHQLRAVGFDYGQRHRKELEFAGSFAAGLGVPFEVISLAGLTSFLNRSALTNADIGVPDGHYADESMKITVVPNRNMILLSVAIGYAENLGYAAVAIANHTGDHAIYNDCRPEFMQAMDYAAGLATYHGVRVLSPFQHLSKTEIVAIGMALGVDYAGTWSCYKGGDTQCGTCGTCFERNEALAESSTVDVEAALAKVHQGMSGIRT